MPDGLPAWQVCEAAKGEDEVIIIGLNHRGDINVYASRAVDASEKTVYQLVGQLEDAKQFLLAQLENFYGNKNQR